MRAARWGRRGIELAERELGPLAPGWVRLRVRACGICGTDLHSWQRESPVDPQGIPGHEIAAVPSAPGAIAGLGPEGLVAVEPRSGCGRCALCRSGRRHLCGAGLLFGVSAPGGLAEQIDVPRACVHPVPAGVSPLRASLAEPLAVALRAVRRAALGVQSRVLVLGAGTIGLLCARLAREHTAAVAIVARHAAQAAAARRLGLQVLSPAERADWAEAEGPDVVLETVGGRAQTLNEAVACARPGGRIVVLGLFAGYRPFDARSFLIKELELVASNTYGDLPGGEVARAQAAGTAPATAEGITDGAARRSSGAGDRGHERAAAASSGRGSEFAAALALLPRLAAELATLQTHQFPLERVEAAFRCAADKASGAIKVTVQM